MINRWTDAAIFLAFASMPDCLTHGCVWDLGGEVLGSRDSTGVERSCHYWHLRVVPRNLGFWSYFGIKISRGTEPYQERWLDIQKWGHGETMFADDDNHLSNQQCFCLLPGNLVRLADKPGRNSHPAECWMAIWRKFWKPYGMMLLGDRQWGKPL